MRLSKLFSGRIKHLMLLTAVLWSGSVCASSDGLAAALQATVTRNPAAQSKAAELQGMGYKIEEAKGGRYPSFSIQANSMSNSNNQGLVRVQQILWAFGKIDGAIQTAENRERSALLSLLQVCRQLIEETAAVYVNLQGSRQRLVLAEQNVKEHEQLRTMIQRRSEGGVASEADLRLASSRLILATSLRDQLRGQIEKTRQDLFALTRLNLQANQPVESHTAELKNISSLQALLESNEAKSRLKQAELEVIRAEGAQRQSELMPSLYARAERDINPATSNQANGERIDASRVGIVLEASVDGFGVVGWQRLKAEGARVVAAQADLDAARNDAQRRLSTLMAERDIQQGVMQSNQASTQALQETLDSFLRQYDAGRKSWIDVLNTQRELADIRQQLAQSQIAWLENSLRVAAFVGLLDELAGINGTAQ